MSKLMGERTYQRQYTVYKVEVKRSLRCVAKDFKKNQVDLYTLINDSFNILTQDYASKLGLNNDSRFDELVDQTRQVYINFKETLETHNVEEVIKEMSDFDILDTYYQTIDWDYFNLRYSFISPLNELNSKWYINAKTN